jgi:hypothetical protein
MEKATLLHYMNKNERSDNEFRFKMCQFVLCGFNEPFDMSL